MYKDEDEKIYEDIIPKRIDGLDEDKEDEVMENQVSVEEYREELVSMQTAEPEVVEAVQAQAVPIEPISSQESSAAQSETPQHKECYYVETVNKKNNKKTSSFKRFIAACVVISLFGGAGIGATYSAMENLVFNKNTSSTEELLKEITTAPETDLTLQSSSQPVVRNDGALTAVEVIDRVFPSVVNINVNVSGTTSYYGIPVPYQGSGSGSGVIFSMDDEYVYIVTNNHVINNANEISVSITGSESIPATVVGSEASADMAVVKALISDFHTAGINEIVAAEFGNSDNLKVGESVIAIGNALGEGKSATGGMISILNKNIEVGGIGLEVIQTSSPINEGNSGGALVNYAGEVIGINTAKSNVTTAEAMGYAIPSNTVKEIMNKLLIEGTTPKPYIGIVGSNITEENADMYKLPIGVIVRQVYEDSGADAAGLQPGDIIISLADKPIMTMERLLEVVKEQEIGSTVAIGIIRNGDTPMTLNIKIMDANNLS